jgi:uncharacterized damage-inducible protein DinB
MDKHTLITQLNTTSNVLNANLDGITHEDSLVDPQAAGNNINWVLGHIARARNGTLELLGKGAMFPMEKYEAYDTPLTDHAKAVKMEELLSDIRAMQEPIVEGIGELSDDAATRPAPFSPRDDPNETVGSLLALLLFHEAYHTGQTGILRRTLGKPGAVEAPNQKTAG